MCSHHVVFSGSLSASNIPGQLWESERSNALWLHACKQLMLCLEHASGCEGSLLLSLEHFLCCPFFFVVVTGEDQLPSFLATQQGLTLSSSDIVIVAEARQLCPCSHGRVLKMHPLGASLEQDTMVVLQIPCGQKKSGCFFFYPEIDF